MLCNELRKMLAFVKKLYTDEVALKFKTVKGRLTLFAKKPEMSLSIVQTMVLLQSVFRSKKYSEIR